MASAQPSGSWLETQISSRKQRSIGNSGRRAEVATGRAAIDDHAREHHLRPERLDHLDRFEQRCPAGGRVLDHDDAVGGQQGPSESPGDPMVLRLLADAETPEVPTTSRGDRGHPERHRVGAHGEPADRVGLERHDLEQRVGDREDAIRSTRGLLGIEKPRTGRTRLQGELPALDGMPQHVVAERVEHGGKFGKIAHLTDSTDDAPPAESRA